MLAVAIGSATFLACAAAAAAAGTHVSLAVRAKPPGSDRILLTGRVTPAPRTARVEVQAQRPQGWRKLAGGPVAHGAFKFSTRATGALVLRARAFQGKRLLGVSAVRKLSVAGRGAEERSAARSPVAARRAAAHPREAATAPGRPLHPPPKTRSPPPP